MKTVLPLVSTIFRKVSRTLAVVLLALPSIPSFAAIVTYTTADSMFNSFALNQGRWSTDGHNFNSTDAYSTGEFPGLSFRSFFTFDLSGLPGVVTSATLRVMRGFGSTSSEDIQLFLSDVTTPAVILNTSEGANQAIVDDLGSGESYGSFTIPKGGPPWVGNFEYLLLSLNGSALADINAAGGFFSIGAMTGPPEQSVFGAQSIFGGTGSSGPDATGKIYNSVVTYLDLTIQPAVPISEPGTVGLLGLGILCLVLSGRRECRRGAAWGEDD
jgi:hypothetical protein